MSTLEELMSSPAFEEGRRAVAASSPLERLMRGELGNMALRAVGDTVVDYLSPWKKDANGRYYADQPMAEPYGKTPAFEKDFVDRLYEALDLGSNFLPAGAGLRGVKAATAARRGIEALLAPEKPLASKSASLYHPPAKPLRPFEADYPQGASADATGRLTHDIEGRPLTAHYIAGRRSLGRADEALTSAELNAVAEAALGSKPQAVAAGALPRAAVGSYDPNTNSTRVLRTLDDAARNMVAAHEVSHGIERLAGAVEFDGPRIVRAIPQEGIKKELGTVYNDLNNGYLASARAKKAAVDPEKVYWGTGVTPTRTFGYKLGHDADRELMAEAIRAYMADPNYLKATAPHTAARIREYVNANPRLSKTIQFNSLAGGALAGNGSLIPVDHDPFAP